MSSSIVSSGTAAILEKYAALNNGIDEYRRDSIQINTQLETIRNEMAELLFKCNEMNDQIQQAKLEKNQLANVLKEAKMKKSNLQHSKDDALSAYDNAKRELLLTQHHREEGRVQFIKECKQYRETCKLIRLGALIASGSSTEGEAHVSYSNAFQILPSEIDECSYCSEDESPSVPETFPHIEYTKERESHDDASSMSDSVLHTRDSPHPQQPLKRNTVKKSLHKWAEIDPEIKEAREKESSALNHLLIAKRELDQAIAERDERSLKAEDRMDNFDQQQAQLERIQKDVESMELDLIALEKNTKEASLMSEGFAKDISRRKALRDSDRTDRTKRLQSCSNQRSDHAISRSTRPQATTTDLRHQGQSNNPYKKSTELSIMASNNNQSSSRQQKQNTIERQHPHRAGKIRVDKQFQVHLQVSALLDDEDMSSSSSSDESTCHKNQQKITTYSSKTKSRTGQVLKENKSIPLKHYRKSSRFSDSDDDDDDRELFCCAPFAKASRNK